MPHISQSESGPPDVPCTGATRRTHMGKHALQIAKPSADSQPQQWSGNKHSSRVRVPPSLARQCLGFNTRKTLGKPLKSEMVGDGSSMCSSPEVLGQLRRYRNEAGTSQIISWRFGGVYVANSLRREPRGGRTPLVLRLHIVLKIRLVRRYRYYGSGGRVFYIVRRGLSPLCKTCNKLYID